MPTLGDSVLRYSTSFIPIARIRSRRFGKIALTCPTVTPKVAVMEPTTSFLNGLGVRAVMWRIAKMLDRQHWNYGFVYENALLEGKQSLDGIETLILPRGLCLKPKVSAILRTWIKRGGTLIALMPPGIYNQYGLPDKTLFNTIMGDVVFKLNNDLSQMIPSRIDEDKTAIEKTEKKGCLLLKTEYGKGTFCVYTKSDPLPEEHLLKLVKDNTKRDVFTESGVFRVVLRESEQYLYLFVVNPDLYEQQEDVIVLAGSHPGAVDLGCDAAFPVKSTIGNDTTRFKLRLHPGEGTVIRVNR